MDNNQKGGYDQNTYATFNPQQELWPLVSNVIPESKFIGYAYPGIPKNCMDYAKAQIAVKGYQISDFGDFGQTILMYNENTGVYINNVTNGLSYLKYALMSGIPVIVGVDNHVGYGKDPNNPKSQGNPDKTTDHFIVIVGMGQDATGKFFTFYDNAVANPIFGTSVLNRLYYDSSNGMISGTANNSYAQNPLRHKYILTQIRKSKLK